MADDLDEYAGNIMVDEYTFSLVEFLAEKNKCRVEDVFKVAVRACMFMAKQQDAGEDLDLLVAHGGNFYFINLWDMGQKYLREGRGRGCNDSTYSSSCGARSFRASAHNNPALFWSHNVEK